MPPFKQAETDTPDVDRAARLRRIRLRCWRRGMRETDLILGRFSDTHLEGLDAEALDQLELLLEENDQEILLWITGQKAVPAGLEGIIRQIKASIQPKI